MKKSILVLSFISFVSCFTLVYAQELTVEQLMKQQEAEENAQNSELAAATFESSRLIIGHSIETTKKRNLDLRISHRFGRVNDGFYDFFGLDYASMRFGFDYGITDRLTVGIGRSTWDKEYDLLGIYKILRQSSGKRNMPVSLTAMAKGMLKTIKIPNQERTFSENLSSTCQLLVARKFSRYISVQVSPIWLHCNLVPENNPNDIFSLGFGGSVRITKRVRCNIEFYPLFSDNKFENTVPPLSIGFDIQTGGHVFQVFVSNTIANNERVMLTQTTDKWGKGQIHIGFNILRAFEL